MKKLFILTISLILLFGFVSCDNATKEPTSSSTTIPGEITPPEPSKLVDINEEQVKAIGNALTNYQKVSTISYTSHNECTIKDGTKIKENEFSGSYTRDTDYVKFASILNGELKVNGDEYSFNNYKIKMNDQGEPEVSGSFTIKGEPAKIDAMDILSPIMDSSQKEYFSKLSGVTNIVYELSSSNKEELEITGTYAMSQNYDLESDLDLKIIVIDAKVDGKSLQFKETISYAHEDNNTKVNYTINYFGYDGVFFNEESIKKVFPNNPF